MSRYIDADKFKSTLEKASEKMHLICGVKGVDIGAVIKAVDMFPTAYVVEVRHGEWVVDAYNGDEIVRIPYVIHEHDEPYCSLCGTYALLDGKEDYVPSNFCPRCGAKMDGERSKNEQN